MDDGYIYVDYTHLNDVGDSMAQQTKIIAGIVERLETELQPLKNTWIGLDATEYQNRQREWDGAVLGMQRLLTSHAGLLAEIGSSYKQSENQLADLWSQVTIGR
ncbi:WXG100 family type VII secretion target [Streptomyces griseoflavus]|nr:WXG100 family type VII secretion target [Streptomyces griseoflavus]